MRNHGEPVIAGCGHKAANRERLSLSDKVIRCQAILRRMEGSIDQDIRLVREYEIRTAPVKFWCGKCRAPYICAGEDMVKPLLNIRKRRV